MLIRQKRSVGRDAATIIGGVAAGIAASRLLPPIVAMARGSIRARLGDDPFDQLVRDHRQIQATLDKMVEMADDSPARRLPLLLALKRRLSKHAIAEEDVVYPLLHDQPGATEAAKHLYQEHAGMKIHLYHLESGIAEDASWGSRVRSLRELILGHIRDEEEVEFPQLREVLDDRFRQSLSGKIYREEALVL